MLPIIRIGRKQQVKPIFSHQALGVVFTPLSLNGGLLVKTDFFERLKLPSVESLNNFEVLGLQKILVEMNERTFFSVCDVSSLIELLFKECSYSFTSEAKNKDKFKVIKNLRHIHCYDYKNIPGYILNGLPEMINFILGTGALNEIPDEIVREIFPELVTVEVNI